MHKHLIKKINVFGLTVVFGFLISFGGIVFGYNVEDVEDVEDVEFEYNGTICTISDIEDKLPGGDNEELNDINVQEINDCIKGIVNYENNTERQTIVPRIEYEELVNDESKKSIHKKLFNVYFKYIDKDFDTSYNHERECINNYYIDKYPFEDLKDNSICSKYNLNIDLFDGKIYNGSEDSGYIENEYAKNILKEYKKIINYRTETINLVERYRSKFGSYKNNIIFSNDNVVDIDFSNKKINHLERISEIESLQDNLKDKIENLYYESNQRYLLPQKIEIDRQFGNLRSQIYGRAYDIIYSYFESINNFDVNRNEINGNEGLNNAKEKISIVEADKEIVENINDLIVERLDFEKYLDEYDDNVFVNNSDEPNYDSFQNYIDYLHGYFTQIEENYFNKRIELESGNDLIVDNPNFIEQLSGEFIGLGKTAFQNVLKKMNIQSQKQFYQIQDLSKLSIDDLSQKEQAIEQSFDILTEYTNDETIKNKIQKTKQNNIQTLKKIKERKESNDGTIGLRTHKQQEGSILVDTGSSSNGTNTFKCFNGQKHIQLTGLVENSGEFIKYKGTWLTESGKPLKCNDIKERKSVAPKNLLELTELDTKLQELGVSYDQTNYIGEINTDKFNQEVPDNQPTFIDIVYLQIKTISKINSLLKKISLNNTISEYFVNIDDYESFVDWTDKLLNYEDKQSFIDAFSDSITFKDIYLGNKFVFDAVRSLNCKLDNYDSQCRYINFDNTDNFVDTDSIVNYFDNQKNQFHLYLNNIQNISISTSINSNYQNMYSYFRSKLFSANSPELFDIGYNLDQRKQNIENVASSHGSNLLKIYNFYNQLNNTVKVSPWMVYLDYIDKSDFSNDYKKYQIEKVLVSEIPYTNSEEIYELEADDLELTDEYSEDEIVGDLNRVYEPVLSGGFDTITGTFYNTIQDSYTNKEKYSFLKKLVKFSDYVYTDDKHKINLDSMAGLNYSLLSNGLVYKNSSLSENQNPTVEFDSNSGFAVHIKVSGEDLLDENNNKSVLTSLDNDISLGQDANRLYINESNVSDSYTDIVNDLNKYDLVWYIKNKNGSSFENKLFIKKESNDVYQKILEENIDFNKTFDKIKGIVLGSKSGESWQDYNGILNVEKVYRSY